MTPAEAKRRVAALERRAGRSAALDLFLRVHIAAARQQAERGELDSSAVEMIEGLARSLGLATSRR